MKGLIGNSEKQNSRSSWSKVLKFGVAATVGVLFFTGTSCHIGAGNRENDIDVKIQEFLAQTELDPLRPESYVSDPSKLRAIYQDDEFKNSTLKKFQGSIKIDTQSFDNYPNPKDDIKPWLKFFKFHDYLEESFPLVHDHLKLEKPNKVNLLYTWTGSNPDLKPLLLTAHQDTVPIDEKSLDQWKYDPLSAHFDGEYVWGRGSVDCKQLVIGLLQTVEKLIGDGFKPERTLLLAFGHDEESLGYGASAINETLTERYGPDSIYAIVDEGATINKVNGNWYALPATTEKGRINIEISLNTPGGHSSVPPDHTSIGIISQLINLFEDNQFKPLLTPKNPFFHFLQKLAKTSKDLPEDLRNDILRAEFDEDANSRVVKWISSDITKKYLIQTSQAVDIIKGGVKSNALPEFASFVYNSRISVESTVDETVKHVLEKVKVIANKFDIGVKLEDEVIIEPTTKGFFTIINQDSIDALPVTPSSGSVWDVLEGTIKHVYEDEVLDEGEKIYTSPAIMTGNTDTRFYYRLTKNVFRFYGARIEVSQDLGLHSINEHIPFKSFLEGIGFLYELIQNVDQAKDN